MQRHASSRQVWLSPAFRDDAPSSAPMPIRGNDHQPGITSAPAHPTLQHLLSAFSQFPSLWLTTNLPNTTIQSNAAAVRPPFPVPKL